jgi:hypothetical protein
MCLTFEITNSAIVMFLEFFHILVLFNWVPYEDNVANAQELFGGVTYLSTMIFASLPALLGPAEMPEFLSDFMIMGFALAGTAAAAISCIASSVFALLGLIAGMIAQMIAPVQALMGGMCAGGGLRRPRLTLHRRLGGAQGGRGERGGGCARHAAHAA